MDASESGVEDDHDNVETSDNRFLGFFVSEFGRCVIGS
jgi:hypothetical protein